MPVKFYAPHWGNTLPFTTFCENVKSAGYDGIEMALPLDPEERQFIVDAIRRSGLELIGQYWQSFEKDIDEHLVNYEKYLHNLIAVKPVLINCQTGKDYFSYEQNKKLFDLAEQLSQSSGIKIVHETHRGKSLYSAPVAKDYLTQISGLRICLDISHWCAVHESLLADQQEAVALALSRADHIHSRVGHAEGPQVNDPRAPEWTEAVAAHLSWWEEIAAMHRQKGSTLRITTEFGPAPYMPLTPYTQMPLANQWEINVHMMNLLKERLI